jgi:hypothetical protein
MTKKQNLDTVFNTEQKVWLSDFQSDNENCPVELRKLILETFKSKKTTKNKKIGIQSIYLLNILNNLTNSKQ